MKNQEINYKELIDLVNTFKKTNKDKDLFKVLDKINNEELIRYMLSGEINRLELLKLKEFIDPQLLTKIAYDVCNIENLQIIEQYIPKLIRNNFINHFKSEIVLKEKINELNQKINNMESLLNTFSENKIDSIVLRAKNIFKDQISPFVEEKENLEKNILKSKEIFKNKLFALNTEELSDLSFGGNPFRGKGGGAPEHAYDRIRKINEELSSSYFNDDDLMKKYLNTKPAEIEYSFDSFER